MPTTPRKPAKRQLATATSILGNGRRGGALPSFGHTDDDGPAAAASPLQTVPITDVHPNPNQPRRFFDQDALEQLAESIADVGILQPPVVRPRSEGGFELIAGERRWRAAQLAEQTDLQVLIREEDDTRTLEYALIENVTRQDLTPVEEAVTYKSLVDDLGVSAADLAKRTGRSRSDIANTIRLLDLPEEVIEQVDAGAISKGHAKVLLSQALDDDGRIDLTRQILENGWSVRTLEHEVALLTGAQDDRTAATPPGAPAAADAAPAAEDEQPAGDGGAPVIADPANPQVEPHRSLVEQGGDGDGDGAPREDQDDDGPAAETGTGTSPEDVTAGALSDLFTRMLGITTTFRPAGDDGFRIYLTAEDSIEVLRLANRLGIDNTTVDRILTA